MNKEQDLYNRVLFFFAGKEEGMNKIVLAIITCIVAIAGEILKDEDN